jgi:hypothetical protein
MARRAGYVSPVDARTKTRFCEAYPFFACKLCMNAARGAGAFAQGGRARSNFKQAAPAVATHLWVMAVTAADNTMKETVMLKKLVIGAALAALLGTAALAQSYDPDEGGGNINPPVASLQGQQAPNDAYAFTPQRMRTTRFVHNWQRQQDQSQQER